LLCHLSQISLANPPTQWAGSHHHLTLAKMMEAEVIEAEVIEVAVATHPHPNRLPGSSSVLVWGVLHCTERYARSKI